MCEIISLGQDLGWIGKSAYLQTLVAGFGMEKLGI
uniref:Uncharacterized protein n=1 Tax=Rhizophora mucronata TaxID=61149 RepID=A0A2P2N0V2_RHIMU